MRLVNTATGRLEGPFLGAVPEYAILSHTWGDEELSLQQFACPEACTHLKGFQKIQSASKNASQYGYQYIWIDTVCIDKTSSAELSEAINSMFNWYLNADICFVHLEDFDQDLGGCRWFTRGWTLQELIAPKVMLFLDANWNFIGTKESLLTQIQTATLINEGCLTKHRSPGTFSVADRMSWASRRQTTRPEDIAYCLLGLFRVNMPLLYGEGGERAFLRLQHEILQVSNDQTILAWSAPEDASYGWNALAASPGYFDPQTSYLPTWCANDGAWLGNTKQSVTFRTKKSNNAILLKCRQANSSAITCLAVEPLLTDPNEYIRILPRIGQVTPKHLSEYSEDVTITLRADILDFGNFVREN